MEGQAAASTWTKEETEKAGTGVVELLAHLTDNKASRALRVTRLHVKVLKGEWTRLSAIDVEVVVIL